MTIKPLGERVVIKMLETEEVTKAASYFPAVPRKGRRLPKSWQSGPAAMMTRAERSKWK